MCVFFARGCVIKGEASMCACMYVRMYVGVGVCVCRRLMNSEQGKTRILNPKP